MLASVRIEHERDRGAAGMDTGRTRDPEIAGTAFNLIIAEERSSAKDTRCIGRSDAMSFSISCKTRCCAPVSLNGSRSRMRAENAPRPTTKGPQYP